MQTAMITFGARMRVRREMVGMSQQKVSDQLFALSGVRIHDSAIARLEKGRRKVSLDEAVQIAEILGVDLHYMIDADVPADMREHLASKVAAVS